VRPRRLLVLDEPEQRLDARSRVVDGQASPGEARRSGRPDGLPRCRPG
jgi:hypothetical protein